MHVLAIHYTSQYLSLPSVDLHMLHGILEQNQIHDSIHLIVGTQCLHQYFVQCLPRVDGQVTGFSDTTSEMAVNQRFNLKSCL